MGPRYFVSVCGRKKRQEILVCLVADDATQLRRVIDLPVDLDELENDERRAVEKFLKIAKAMGANRGYIARHRKAWWSVGLRSPAPIISTRMAKD